MSFINIFKGPSKLFKKDVISFLVIHRHDLGIIEQRLRYVAVRPTASVSKLREKIWYLLDLPDYCDEIIILKSNDEKEIPLCALCRGNDPQHPYILEVWLTDHRTQILTTVNNMLTMGYNESNSKESRQPMLENIHEEEQQNNPEILQKIADTTGIMDKNQLNNILHPDHKRSELSYTVSNSSLFFKIPGRNSADNFACILLKIQNDLSTLSKKLSQLEKKINF